MSVQFVDDRDPAIIYNVQHWGHEDDAGDFDGTSNFCNIVGGTATYQFNGPATISVFGTIRSINVHSPGRSTYSIDDGAPETYNPVAQANDQFQVEFFQSTVSSGSHTLVITALDFGLWYYLDFIKVVSLPNPSTHSTTINTPPPSTPTKSSQQPVTSSPHSLPTTSPSNSGQFVVSFTSNIDSSGGLSAPTLAPGSSSTFSIPNSASTGSLDFSSLPSGMATVFITRTESIGASITGGAVPDSIASGSSANTLGDTAGSHHSPTGEIVGTVIGGVIFVALLLGIVYFMIKRKRQNSDTLSSSSRQRGVSPFVLAEVDTSPPRYSNVYDKNEKSSKPPPKGPSIQ